MWATDIAQRVTQLKTPDHWNSHIECIDKVETADNTPAGLEKVVTHSIGRETLVHSLSVHTFRA